MLFTQKTSIEAPTQVTFTIYPNPVNDVLTVERSTTDRALIEIFSSNGSLALIQQVEMNETKIEVDVTVLPMGVYLIRLIEGQSVVTQRFVRDN